MGSLGAVLGVALGAFLAWAVVDLGQTPGLTPRYSFSLSIAAAVVVAGVLVAVAAALYPALRTMRTSILDAQRHE